MQVRQEWPKRDEKTWRCACGAGHFMTITREEDDDNYLVVEGAYFPRNWRERLKGAWEMLTGRDHFVSLDIVLTDQVAKEIAAELTKTKGSPFESQGAR